jgi:hypothetical protein
VTPGTVIGLRIDMESRSLAVCVNRSEWLPLAHVTLPAAVRPFVRLYYERDALALAARRVPPTPPPEHPCDVINGMPLPRPPEPPTPTLICDMLTIQPKHMIFHSLEARGRHRTKSGPIPQACRAGRRLPASRGT